MLAAHEGSELRERARPSRRGDTRQGTGRGRPRPRAALPRASTSRCSSRPRREVYARAEADLVALAAEPDEPERAALVDALVECPQPLAPLLTARIHTAAPALRRAMLEVMTRRYYRIRPLEHFAAHTHGDFDLVTADYEHDGGRVHVLTTHLDLADLRVAAEAAAAQMAGIPAESAGHRRLLRARRGRRRGRPRSAARGHARQRGTSRTRCSGSSWRSAAAKGPAWTRSRTSRTGASATALAEDELAARPPPDDGRTAGPLAPRRLPHRASSVGARRVSVSWRRP